ncbi:hypothetical protein E5F05_13405 [Deinococcus metallilatus]|uniref:Carbohydrate binding module xylan-binding domain-containing protein n=1 Tax=Deinococcus metallilatus TaxID=1211322 RepID=A0AAJ5F3M0_9DEIO|nr:Ig-like domain-containing protein [Deinococcus metallilatus]MBB5294060.1 hypothetical protein [Deinococcus metallilatus]QBY08848.1 hypothetical protein E5F05_13405 [Deinococcus metallilatus]RXJ09992.1 hypothetical protein ERJ73_12235 [Deinococcus metallilatus]TLK28071.1 hypothetical protein FCS05_09145 [Deinococcus metallilatus]GMA16605.1 hypothetical protein GCM10025871_29360 [Deinococcus metallilatus]
MAQGTGGSAQRRGGRGAILLLTLGLGLVGCSQTGSVPTAPEALQLEAEAGSIEAGVTPQAVANPRSGGRIISDPAASGGKAVILLGTNDNVRFVVPGSVKAGRYAVSVEGRGEEFRGWPVVDLNDAKQRRLAVATLDSATYVTRKFGDFDLKPGQVFNLSFINDLYEGPDRDRNAIVDYLVIEPVQSPPPVNQAPTVTLQPIDNGILLPDVYGHASHLADNNIILKADASDPDGQVAKVEFYFGASKIGEDTTAPYTFVYPRNRYSDDTFRGPFTARAVDDQGAATTSAEQSAVFSNADSSNALLSGPVLRAINFGGPSVQTQRYDVRFGGVNFAAGDTSGITTNGTPTSVPGSALAPAAEPNREALVRTALSRPGGLEVGVPVPQASYSVFLWVRAEDATPYDIQMEGQTVARFEPGAAGQWKRLGPIGVSVSDGVLNVASTGTATANFSAIEIYRRPQAGDTAPTVTFTSPPADSSITPVPASQPLTLSVDASDPEGIAKVEFFARPYMYGPVQKIGEATSAPYRVVWQNTPTGGLYSVFAVATDNTGVNSSTEARVSFSSP